MKIVDRKMFLSMPAGTVFAKYRPHIIDEPMIKGDTVANDFWYSDLTSIAVPDGGEWVDVADSLKVGGEPIPIDVDTERRDGLFDASQLFAAWDRADVEALIARLQRTLT